MTEKRFSRSHVWAEATGDTATIGITEHFFEGGSEIVMLRLPKIGQKLRRGDLAAEAETLKAANEIPSPLSGEVVEINGALAKKPGLATEKPLSEGWLFRLKMENPAELSDLGTADS